MKVKKPKQRVCVAMSGGVDSAVAAYLLKKDGYDVIGVFLKFWSAKGEVALIENKCCSQEASEDARRVANILKIPLYALNYEDVFKQKIVDSFILDYLKGKTPNPCIKCNQYVKFGKLLASVKTFGGQYLATGHYAKIKKIGGKYYLIRPKDKKKDQTYFLYNLTQNHLPNIIFPLADLTKDEVRKIAKKIKLPVYEKPESQEICFIPDKFYGDFLKNQLKLKPGVIIDKSGKIIGKHQGLALYTIGQRKGINADKPGPYYVINKNPKINCLTVTKDPNDSSLFKKHFKVRSVNWVAGLPQKNKRIEVQIRHQAKPISAKIYLKNNGAEVFLDQEQKAITPGQAAVFYRQNILIGGGIIK